MDGLTGWRGACCASAVAVGVGEAGYGIYRIVPAINVLLEGKQFPLAIVSTDHPSKLARVVSVSSGLTS